MSSLLRILSSERAAQAPPTEASRIVRHSSLPNLVYPPESIRFRPCPTRLLKTGHGNFSISSLSPTTSVMPALCRAKSDNFDESRMSDGCFVSQWRTEVEPNPCAERAFMGSLSRKEARVAVRSLDLENSVVYKELRESLWRLEAPAKLLKSVGTSISEGGGSEIKSGEKVKKNLDSCSAIGDVKGRPMSLRILKRKLSKVKPEASNYQVKQQHMVIDKLRSNQCNIQNNDGSRESLLCDVGGSVGSAFASLVFIMKTLQQHALLLRRTLMSEAHNRLQDVVGKVHAEMQDSFLCLFQQVFSCTPKLMLLTMMLLADFTVHSMGSHVALAVMPMGEPPTATVITIESVAGRAVVEGLSLSDRSADNSIRISLSGGLSIGTEGALYEPSLSEGGEGNGGVRNVKVGGSMDSQAMPNTSQESRAMTVEDDTRCGVNDASLLGYSTLHCDEGCPNVKSRDGSCVDPEEDRMLSVMWEAVSKDNNIIKLPLDTNSKHLLVAPVRAPELEADNYSCYDMTDLNYQHEISMDPGNPLLLVNYAQFLYLVRRDHGRAEEFFNRAMRADPVDVEVMGRLASFLWVAKGDVEEADRAYRAAVAADPSNSFHAGCYAHFLWKSNAGQEDTATCCPPHQHVATS